MFRSVLPDGQFAPPGFASFDHYRKAEAFLENRAREKVRFDFLTLHLFELTDPRNPGVEHMNAMSNHQISQYHGSQFVAEAVNEFQAVAQRTGYNVPIVITEWNVSPYFHDLSRDTCFMSAYIVDTINHLPDCVDSISFWALADLNDEHKPQQDLFSGELCMRTNNDLAKPSYLAFTLLKRAQGKVLVSGDSYRGVGGTTTDEFLEHINTVLLDLEPSKVFINSFLVERTPERITGFFVSALMAILVLVLSMVISRLILGRHAIDNFAGSFANPGFFGVPLIVASIGQGGVFYIAAFIAFLNLLQWTYGVSLLENSDENGLLVKKAKQSNGEGFSKKAAALTKRFLTAPFMMAILIGMFFFLTGIPMLSVLSKSVSYIAGLNTPIAMFAIGVYMAQTDILKMFAKPRLYLVSLVRMIIIPAVAIALLSMLPASMNEMKLAVLIAAACPVGSNVAVYAQLYNKNFAYAVETVVISTLLSIVTLPLVCGIAGIIF